MGGIFKKEIDVPQSYFDKGDDISLITQEPPPPKNLITKLDYKRRIDAIILRVADQSNHSGNNTDDYDSSTVDSDANQELNEETNGNNDDDDGDNEYDGDVDSNNDTEDSGNEGDDDDE